MELDSDTYIPGDTIVANVLELANPGAETVAVEVKTWFEDPTGKETPKHNVGTKGTLKLAPESSRDYGPLTLMKLTGSAPTGWYNFSCRIVNPATGRQLSFDQNWFEVQAP